MAYTNEDILDIINFYTNKDQSGNTMKPSLFNKLLPAACHEFFEDQRKVFEATMEITNAIRHLKVTGYTPSLSIVSGMGRAAFAADYAFGDKAMYYVDGGSQHRKIEVLTDSQFNNYRNSPIRTPSTKYPIARFSTTYIEYLPSAITGIFFDYIKYFTNPVLDYYIDANYQIVYFTEGQGDYTLQAGEEGSAGQTAGTVTPLTVDMDWRDEDQLKIGEKVVRAIGINIKEGELAQYAMAREQQNK